MASLKSRFSINKINPKLFLLVIPIVFVIPFVFTKAEAQTFTPAQNVASDVGLTDGESDEGCRYSDQEGLVYFCGYVKNAENYEPLEGVTVAVYEELADGPSLLEPDGIFSPSGKWGGNLAHLFSSTSTNAQGHYEIIARQGRDIHVAFLCGNEFIGGLKRIEEISRIEVLNDLVTCNDRGYAEPPPQLRYTDRSDFLECSVNFVGTLIRGAEEANHFVNTVGLSGNPNFLLNSRIQVQNFDFRFMSFDGIKASLNIPGGEGGIFNELLECALDLDWYSRPSQESCFNSLSLGGVAIEIPELPGSADSWGYDGMGYVLDGAGWIGATSHGAWRMHDCRATYDFWGGDREPKGQPCEDGTMNEFLALRENLGSKEEDLYLVLNQLPYMPRFGGTVAWARVDIRNSIRQVVRDSAQEVRQGDALWDNYIGKVPRVYQKQPVGEGDPGFDEEQGERLDEKNQSDPIISCDELAIQAADINKRYVSSSLSGLANPVEIPSDIMEGELMTEWEYDYPVCRGEGGNKTMREVCLDEAQYVENRLLCRAAMWCVKGAGGSVTPHRSQDDSDSLQREECMRQSIYNPKSNAANDEGPEGAGCAWSTQEWENNTGSGANVHNFNYMCGGFLLGREFDGKNYLNQYGNPTVQGPTDDIDTGDECGAPVQVEGNLLDDDPDNDIAYEYQCETEEAANIGFGESPDIGLIKQPSPNAIKNDVVVQDVGTNNIAKCSVSTMFERIFFDEEGLPTGDEAGGNNKKLELLTYDDLRQPLGNPLAKAAYAILFNFFYGVPQHNEDVVVGSGTFYTAKSYKRDKFLDYRGEKPIKEASRDVFDSLRTLASRGIEVDFQTIGTGDVGNAIVTLFGGDGNFAQMALNIITGIVGGTGAEQKSYAHRKSYEVTNPNLGVMVGYPFWEEPELNEESDPFKIAFFEPTSPWKESNWGNSDVYPWRDIPEGNACMTYVDWPYYNMPGGDPFMPADLYVEIVGDGGENKGNENHSYLYQRDSEGLSRTCRVNNDSYRYRYVLACDGEGNLLEPHAGDEDVHRSDEQQEIRDPGPHLESEILIGGRDRQQECTELEKEWCAIQREDIERFDEALKRGVGGCARTYKCDSDDDGVRDDDCYPTRYATTVCDCSLARAGPYNSPGRMDTKIQNRVTQDSLAPDREEVVPVDGLKEVSDSIAYAFQSPAKMNRQPEYEFIKEYDLAHSKTVDQVADPVTGNVGTTTQGFPVKSIGGVNKGIYDPGSHPYTGTEIIEDNGIVLHCLDPQIPLPSGVTQNSCLDNPGPYQGTFEGQPMPYINCWKCPIAPIPKCKGLFGEMEGIDEIVISPEGELAIKRNFLLDNFEDMLPYYVQAEEDTGVPCEVLAALHFREAGNTKGQSVWDGKHLRGDIQEDVTSAADHLLSKMSCAPGRCGTLCGTPRVPGGLAIKNITDLMQMIAYWGGGGNDNCNPEVFHLTDFEDLHRCPPDYRCGEYDGYVTAYMDSNHEDMAIIWPMDRIDVKQEEGVSDLQTLQDMFGEEALSVEGPINVGGVRADVACYVIGLGLTNRPYTAVGELCPPPIPETRPGALAMAMYIYELSVGLRQP